MFVDLDIRFIPFSSTVPEIIFFHSFVFPLFRFCISFFRYFLFRGFQFFPFPKAFNLYNPREAGSPN